MNSVDDDGFDPTASLAEVPDVAAILAELASTAKPRRLPVTALRAAQRRAEEITPVLIEMVRNAIARAKEGDIPDDDAHFFAAYLLTEFRAKEALPVVVEALRLSEEVDEGLFGDLTTTLFPRTLAVLAEDRRDVIDELIADRDIGIYQRWAAIDVYLHWVAGGKISVADAVDRLRRHLRTAIDQGEDEVTEAFIHALIDLVPSSQAPEIQEVFDKELNNFGIIDREDVAAQDAEGAAGTEKALSNYKRAEVLDTVEELSWFDRSIHEGEEEDSEEILYLDDEDDDLDPDSQEAKAAALRLRGLAQRLGMEPEDLPSDTTRLDAPRPIRNDGPRIGRNDPCPCGSGKKFKKCCGAPK